MCPPFLWAQGHGGPQSSQGSLAGTAPPDTADLGVGCCGSHQDKATKPDAIPPDPASSEQTLVPPPALRPPRWGPSEGELQPLHPQPLHPRQSEAVQAARFSQAKGGQQQLPAALPASSHQRRAPSPARAIAHRGRAHLHGLGLSPRGQHRPGPPEPASPSVSPPGPYPRAMESACSPQARRVSPAPAASAGLWGKRPRDALPSEEAWSHPGSREEAGDCSEHGSKICATNTRTLSHMFKPD